MSPETVLALQLDPALAMEALGFRPDAWQAAVLRSRSDRIMLLCARQLGKSTTTACLGLHTALFQPESLVLLLAPSQRQSGELYQKITTFYNDLDKPVPALRETLTTLHLVNGSRVICLPGVPDLIRGFSHPRLVVCDESALCEDALFVAILPMLAGGGRLVLLSTPAGMRGFFHEAWSAGNPRWERHRAIAAECPRVAPEFLAEQRRLLGDRFYRQEFECSFEQTLDQVFSTDLVLRAFCSDRGPLFPAEPAPTAALPADSDLEPLFSRGRHE